MSARIFGRRHTARLLVVLLTSALAVLVGSPAPRASAAPLPSLAVAAVHLAAAQKGKPYRYGAAGPAAFDCSGLTVYVWRTRLHRNLPRTTAAQYRATVHIPKSRIRPGDLVFFYSGSLRNIYHVGIYAGGGKIWHAPHTGARVRLAQIWTSKWVAGRVR